jgi:polygalacturonase
MGLEGIWRFAIDRENKGHTQAWYKQKLPGQIRLPGSMPENLQGDDISLKTRWEGSLYDSSFFYNPRLEKFRQPGNLKIPFFLTPDKHYIGWAWYQRDVEIPASWKGKRMLLHLERPHVETTVWVNEKKAGTLLSHCVPHEYDITQWLSPGKNTITIAIDNTTREINVGKDSHSITDQTQGNWNGIVGDLSIQSVSPIYFEDIRIFPDIQAKKALVKIKVNNCLKGKQQGSISLSAQSFNSDKAHSVPAVSIPFTANEGENVFEVELPMGDEVQLWDEFIPALYKLNAVLTAGKQTDSRKVQFGMREFTIQGKYFYVNGRKILLRGTVENCAFPLTGYAPMDVASWERVYRICKAHGLNHVRFHSFCPPEAAFIAADLVGIYLQPEGPSWTNHGTGLGLGRPIDDYLLLETQRMTKSYGNYASFCMLACGNEPAGNWLPWVGKFVDYWKASDPRRVYTGASVGNSWAWQARNQYHVKAGARGLAWDKCPETLSDYASRIDTVQQPYVSHETGQWCAFPNFKEIKKYTGVNKARNFELFQEDLADNDMGDLGHDFMMASGKLQALCYKHEIEKTLRTPDYAGFQLLSLNDYSGQGTALVGVLDVFWDNKGYINAEQFRRFCSETVPLMRTSKFVYRNNEILTATIETAHFGKEPLHNIPVTWTLKDAYGKIHASGKLATVDIPIGNCFVIGKIELPLSEIKQAKKLNLEVVLSGTPYVNDWDFFVYPEQEKQELTEVYETDRLDSTATDVLQKGGNVLLLAAGKVEYGKDIVQHLLPVFWNTSWFKMRPPHTTGILVNPYHPVFNDFPTDSHSNLQWWELVQNAQAMQLTDFPKGFRPLIQGIDTWFLNRKIGMLFEAKVLNGKIIVCSADLKNDWENRPVAQQLYTSVVKYMQSNKFRPPYEVGIQQIADIFRKESERTKTYTEDVPDELKSLALSPELPEWTSAVGAKTKPEGKQIINVKTFGAKNDGKTLSTSAIQAAIDACAEKGGGKVIFDEGVYLTGALFVKSHVELHIGKGVTLKAIENIDHFPIIPSRIAGIEMEWPAAIINIIGQKNVSVTGEGIIDGNGKYLWDKYWKMRSDYDKRGLRWIVDYDCLRVRSLLIAESSDITLEGLTFLRAGFWTIQTLYSEQCTIKGITIRNNVGGDGPSTDGIDIDSSNHILIENCDIDCNDDNFCLKAGRDADGLRVNRPTEYVLIRNCIARKGAGLITCGSETSGGIRHIFCTQSAAYGTSAVMRIKSAMTRGGTVEDIRMARIKADSAKYILNCDMNWNPSYSYSSLPAEQEGKELPAHWKTLLQQVPPEQGTPVFRDIYLSNLEGKNIGTFINCIGSEKSYIDKVELSNINVKASEAGTVRYTNHFRMEKVSLHTEDQSEIQLLQAEESANTPSVENQDLSWPEIQQEAKPWTRWWWLGSDVDSTNLTYNLEALSRAGIGGVEITPIYGVKGREAHYIDYLSPKWMKMLSFTESESKRLGMAVDMSNGTGWPFGGPEVTIEEAATKAIFQEYTPESLDSIRIVVKDPKQVPFSYLDKLMAYSSNGEKIDLTDKVSPEGKLNWTAPAGKDYRFIALFVGKTLQQVKRAAPGGQGYVLNHLDKTAVMRYFEKFDKAFSANQTPFPHSFFNDSYEVYDADWTPDLLKQFEQRRGYKLQDHFPELIADGSTDISARVVSDYRETIGDILREDFTQVWTDWAHTHRVSTRNQAHGSPANLIDLYATVDIPECESFGITDFNIPGLRKDSIFKPNDSDPSILKYASSAAHITGKKYTSSETLTWLTEHFRTSLSQCKPDIDLMFTSGVNHVYFHGTAYSPQEAAWPGWKFYAAVDMSPTNSIWKDAPALFNYISRTQSFLQSGTPDNDFLLYLPIYDIWHEQRGKYFSPFSIHDMRKRLPEFCESVDKILACGFDLDYISDRFLQTTTVENGLLKTVGGTSYKALILPSVKRLPVETFAQIIALAQQGATIIFSEQYPEDVPGLSQLKERRKTFASLMKRLPKTDSFDRTFESKSGKGRIITGKDYADILSKLNVRKERFVTDFGGRLIRRKQADGAVYFFTMLDNRPVDNWISLGVEAQSAIFFDPMSGKQGKAQLRNHNGATEVFMQLQPGESILLKTFTAKNIQTDNWAYYHPTGNKINLEGRWKMRFTNSQPIVNETFKLNQLSSWTELDNDTLKKNMGTALYSIRFILNKAPDREYRLHLGDVRESAVVKVNGQNAGTLFAVPFEVNIGRFLQNGENTIEIEVTNLPANRIADYDRQGIEWRIFQEINFVNIAYKNTSFDTWGIVPSGLLGPVHIQELEVF